MNLHRLKREYTSSEGNSDARKRILDLIDSMLRRGLYGIDETIKAHER